MLFCPLCNDLSVTYIDALREALCTNLDHCLYTAKFDSWDECKKVLNLNLKKWAKGSGMTIAPWSGAVIETEMDEATLQVVTGLAKELHGVFTQASVNSKMLEQEGAQPFDSVPENVQDALVELACYVHDNFIRRTDG